MLCLGMWLRKTGFNPPAWVLALLYVVLSMLTFFCQKKISAYNYDFVLNVTAAASLFLLFNKLKIQNKCINFAAKSCFAIFCIHVGPFANTVWTRYFITGAHICGGLGFMLLWTFISVAVMFAGCLVTSVAFRLTAGRLKDWLCAKLPIFVLDKKYKEL